MTATSLDVRASRIARSRRLRHAGAAALVVMAFLLAMLGGAVSAPAHAAATPSPSATPVTPDLSVSPSANGVLRPGQSLRVTADVANPGQEPLPTGTVSLSLGREPLADRAAVLGWMSGSRSADTVPVASTAMPAIDTGGVGSAAITTTVTDPVVLALIPGVYAVQVHYSAGTQSFTERAVITVVAADAAPVTTTTVLPITVPVAGSGLLSSERLAELTSPTGALTADLEAAVEPSVVLAIDPAIPAAIRALGSAAPPSAVTWLTELLALKNERFELPFADADPQVQADAGLPQLLAPLSLDAYLSSDNFREPAVGLPGSEPRPADTPTPTPTESVTASAAAAPTATPTTEAPSDAPVLPTLEQLTDLGDTLGTLVWPTPGSATDAVLPLAAGSPVLVSNDQLASTAGHQAVGDSSILGYDAALADVLRAASEEPAATARGALLATATALLRLDAQQSADPVVVVVGRGTAAQPEALRAALGAVSSGTLITGQPMSRLLAAPPVAGALTSASPSDSGTDRAEALRNLLADEERVTAFSSVLADPSVLVGRERARILQLLSVSEISRDDWDALVAAQRARTQDEIVGAVSIVRPETVTLVSSGSNIPMKIRNDLDLPVTVVVTATPNDLRLGVQKTTVVEAAAHSNTSFSVPVTAGISNGDVKLALSAASPTGVPIGGVQYAEIRVRADWETIGLVILGTIVVVLFSLGTWRTIRRRRADAATGVTPEPNRREARAAYRAGSAAKNDAADAADKEPRG
ncbi:DUF6049 family protein [Microbacterium sp. ZW T5_56]|uniref:DUF6049 family protein n=1 Tax=Microbacterium sp. ZW T5_56 TaxID=3378081 RepID=UPI00385490D8